MEEPLIRRLEAAVTRLEALYGGHRSDASRETGGDASSDPSVTAFEDLLKERVGRVVSAAETIGGEVFDVTKVLEEGFSVQRDLIIQMKQSQVGLVLWRTILRENNYCALFSCILCMRIKKIIWNIIWRTLLHDVLIPCTYMLIKRIIRNFIWWTLLHYVLMSFT